MNRRSFDKNQELKTPKLTTEETILKLRTLQHSQDRKKSMRSLSNQVKQSDSASNTTKDLLTPSLRPRKCSKQRTSQRQCCRLNGTVQELKHKVQFLLNDKNSEQNRSRKASRERTQTRRMSFTSMNNRRGEPLKSSLLSASFDNHSLEQRFRLQQVLSLEEVKMNACRFLQYVNIEQGKAEYLTLANSIEQMFFSLATIINEHSQSQRQTFQYSRSLDVQQQKLMLTKQLQNSLQSEENIRNKYEALQIQSDNMRQRIEDLLTKIDSYETDIFRLKSTLTQTENALMKANNDLKSYQYYVNNTLLTEYQTKFYRQLNQKHQTELSLTQLKKKLSDALTEVQDHRMQKGILEQQVKKWEITCVKLRERLDYEGSQKQTARQQLESEQKIYQQSKQIIKAGYTKLVEHLSQQLTELRHYQLNSQSEAEFLKKTLRETEARIDEMQENYLCLNDDFTQSVQEWVSKQQQYEQLICSLRQQLAEACQSAAEYYKLLAMATSENLAFVQNKSIKK